MNWLSMRGTIIFDRWPVAGWPARFMRNITAPTSYRYCDRFMGSFFRSALCRAPRSSGDVVQGGHAAEDVAKRGLPKEGRSSRRRPCRRNLFLGIRPHHPMPHDSDTRCTARRSPDSTTGARASKTPHVWNAVGASFQNSGGCSLALQRFPGTRSWHSGRIVPATLVASARGAERGLEDQSPRKASGGPLLPWMPLLGIGSDVPKSVVGAGRPTAGLVLSASLKHTITSAHHALRLPDDSSLLTPFLMRCPVFCF